MPTAREQAIQTDGDTFQVRMDKIDSLFEGDKLVAKALGEDYYIDQTTGEMMAQNDYNRNNTASGFASWIMDALRFARADSAKFQGFVEGLREIHAKTAQLDAELGGVPSPLPPTERIESPNMPNPGNEVHTYLPR